MPVILLVGNEPDFACLVQMALFVVDSTLSLKVLSEEQEAINYLNEKDFYFNRKKFIPRLIIINFSSSNSTYFDFLKWLNSSPELKNKTVVIGNSKKPGFIKQIYSLGCDTYFVKPINLGEMIIILKTLISRS